MLNSNAKKPVVLVLGGHDPSGGAGIQADIESIAGAGCHAATIITALTTQSSCRVVDVTPRDTDSYQRQLSIILDDMQVGACKIGLLGDNQIINATYKLLSTVDFPIVLDPVIASGTGTVFTDAGACKNIISSLLPITTVLTPNSIEARKLSGEHDLKSAAKFLIDAGTDNILITGTHETSAQVINTHYANNMDATEYSWERLPGSYHGSGCTLSARIAAGLALDKTVQQAIEEAQNYTWHTLKHGLRLGPGQSYPNRFFNN